MNEEQDADVDIGQWLGLFKRRSVTGPQEVIISLLTEQFKAMSLPNFPDGNFLSISFYLFNL